MSMSDERFVEALVSVVESELEERAAMLDYLSDDLSAEEWDWMMDVMHPITLDEFHQIRKAWDSKERAKKRPPQKNKINTKKVLRYAWLPLVLWEKTSGEILFKLPMLKSGDSAENFDKDTNKINTALGELKWYRAK